MSKKSDPVINPIEEPVIEPKETAPKKETITHEIKINAESLEKAFNSFGEKLMGAIKLPEPKKEEIIQPKKEEISQPKKEEKYLIGQEFDIFGDL